MQHLKKLRFIAGVSAPRAKTGMTLAAARRRVKPTARQELEGNFPRESLATHKVPKGPTF